MAQIWNLELAQNLKDLFFGGGLPTIILFICFIAVVKSDLHKIIKILMTFSTIMFLFFCFHFTPNTLLNLLLNPKEKQVEKNYNETHKLIYPSICAQNTNAIVILGGGVTYAHTPSESTLTRLLGLKELLQDKIFYEKWRKKQFPIIFTGGHTEPKIEESEAHLLKKYALFLMGETFSNLNTLTEDESKNTYQNALFTKEIFIKNNYPKNIILITNSAHMRRAQKTFIAQGFHVCSFSVSSNNLNGSGLFSFSNALKTNAILNEYFGIIGYFMKGWIKF